MKQIIRDIIEDQKRFLSNRQTIDRSFKETYLTNELIVIITGVRRCGKSVLLQQIRKKIDRNDYFFNFDDERLTGFTVDNFQDLYEVFIEMYGEQDCFFFDEIQNIKGWEHFVKRLYNQGKKVFVTGSNANMLSRELGTLLTGCYVAVELYPFSFLEYLTFNGRTDLIENHNGTVRRAEIQSLFGNYLQQGGFPLYLKTEDDQLLETLYENILYRDVMVRNQITNERELKEMIYYLVSNIGKPITYTSLQKVMNVKNPTTCKAYLDYIENTYLLSSIMKIDDSVKVQIRNPKKVYCIDNALSLRLGYRISHDYGRMLENLVFIELRRRGHEVFYYNDAKSECDFVVRRGFRVEAVYQVCYEMNNVATREREINGLIAAMNRYSLCDGYIITNSQQDSITVDGKTIRVVACWRWLMNE